MRRNDAEFFRIASYIETAARVRPGNYLCFFTSYSYLSEIAARLSAHPGRNGLSVPGDVAIVSFDNSQYSEMSTPRITSLSHEQYNVGRLAAELLFRHLRGEVCASELVPWVLNEKESS